jgi:acyl carrier protein
MDVRTRIRQYFSGAIAEEISDDDDIFELGATNSLFAIQLVTFVESEFSITAEREDLNIANFSSISALTNFVLRKLDRLGDLQIRP